MSAGNNVFIYPEFLFVDNFDGAEHYQPSDDPAVTLANRYTVLQNAPQILLDLYLLGLSEAEAEEKLLLLLELDLRGLCRLQRPLPVPALRRLRRGDGQRES